MKITRLKIIQHFAAVSVPLTLGISFILSTGPQVQSYVFALLNSDIPSVYGSAYKDEFVTLPKLGTWIATAFEWHFMTMSAALAYVIERQRHPRRVAATITVTSLLVLSIFDLGFGMYYNMLSPKWFGENLSGNIIGALIISGVIVIALAMANFCYRHAPTTMEAARRAAAATAFIIIGGACSCVVYYICDLFYYTLPVKLEAYVAAPARGAAIPKVSKSETGEPETDRPFSFLPKDEMTANLSWQSGDGPFSVQLNEKLAPLNYDIAITLLSGCMGVKQVKELKPSSPWVKLEGVKSFAVFVDPGMTFFDSLFPEKEKQRVELITEETISFHFGQDEESKDMKMTQFVSPDSILRVDTRYRKQGFLFYFALMDSTDKKIKLMPRTVTMKVDGEPLTIAFSAPPDRSESDRLGCQRMTQGEAPSTPNIFHVTPHTIIGGVLIEVERQPSKTIEGEVFATQYAIRGGAGWVWAYGLKPSEMESDTLGKLELFQMQGNISDLVIDGISVAPRPADVYTAQGEFAGTYTREGKLRVTGRANQLWRDKARMNPTKWENLGWEAKIFLLGALGALGAMLLRMLIVSLKKEQEFEWPR